jgi:FdrA protein
MKSSYYDSVVLMRVASQLKKEAGVSEVAMFMGTEGNHALLNQVGLATKESRYAGPEDLIIIVQADSERQAQDTTEKAMTMLSERSEHSDSEFDYRPRTLDTALDFLPNATFASISIPGEFATREALKCINHGLNVFLFSDNVPIEAEISLKKKARETGLIFMGPDCGTAYINGVGLGFANVIKPGRIGCIAASGTGLQAVVCQLDRRGEGVSHAIGVGGRDLSSEVGGIMTMHGLELLEQDQETEVIILISKPPSDFVVSALESICATMSTPVVTCFQGVSLPEDTFVQAKTLDEAANMAVCLANKEEYLHSWFDDPLRITKLLDEVADKASGKTVLGLFTGGTLAKEAQLLLAKELGPIEKTFNQRQLHSVVDLGDDQYTIGRPHPMIAPESRTEKLFELAKKGSLARCGVLLVDLVLGNGSHLDPAHELAQSVAALRETSGVSPEIVAVVVGTEMDPQDLKSQINTLEDCNITVFHSNREAACYTAMLISPDCRGYYMKEA